MLIRGEHDTMLSRLHADPFTQLTLNSFIHLLYIHFVDTQVSLGHGSRQYTLGFVSISSPLT